MSDVIRTPESIPESGPCMVELGLIRENPVALRAVNRKSEKYLGLVDSLREHGLMNPINVRVKEDDKTSIAYLEIVDGLHRFSGCRDADIPEIPVNILQADDARALELQLVGNFHKIDTKPHQYAEHLIRLLGFNALMTETDLAKKLGVSTDFIKKRLSLNKIQNENIQKLIDDGEINLTNAYSLAKLPPDEQANFVADAMKKSPGEFAPAVDARVKEIKEANKKGKTAGPLTFSPSPHSRKVLEIKSEIGLVEGEEAGVAAKAVISATGETNPVEAFDLGVKWVLHLDPSSIEEQKAQWEAGQVEKAEAKAKADAIKAAKAKKKAAKLAKDAAEAEAKANEALVREGVDDFDINAELAKVEAAAAKKKADREAKKVDEVDDADADADADDEPVEM